MIHREDRGRVAVLRMEHGKANAIDPELLSDLGLALADAERTGASAVVLTGTGTTFSAGVNLFRVMEGGPAYLEAFLPALSEGIDRLLSVPLPVVAAINGHALAGGCVLAAACDLRIMAEGTGRIGVTELRVGVPFPAIALEAFRAAVPGPRGDELVYRGAALLPPEALACGLVHRLVPAESLLGESCALAEELGNVPRPTFAVTKRQLRAEVRERVRAVAHLEEDVRRLWSDPLVHAAVQSFVAANVGKK